MQGKKTACRLRTAGPGSTIAHMEKNEWNVTIIRSSRKTLSLEMQPDGTPKITWSPDLREDAVPRTYTTMGKATLLDKDWTPVTEENRSLMHFFKVTVEIK